MKPKKFLLDCLEANLNDGDKLIHGQSMVDLKHACDYFIELATSEEYIQSLIDSGRIVIDEDKLVSHFLPHYHNFDLALNCYMNDPSAEQRKNMHNSIEEGLKAITQSNVLKVKEQ